MDHNYINKFDLVDRYVMGKLAEDEELAFEEHFVDCPNCIEQIKITERFLHDLRHEIIQNASRADSTERIGAFQYLRRLLSGKMLVMAAASLIILLGAMVAVWQITRLRSEVAQTRDMSRQWENRYDQQRKAREESDKKHEDSERELTGRLTELEARLQNPGLSPDGVMVNPQINVPFVSLQSVRGGNSKPNEIGLSKSAKSFLMMLPITGENHKTYRVIIKNDHDQTRWKSDSLTPVTSDFLTVSFDSGFFRSGSYMVVLEASDDGINFQPVGDYLLHVIKNN